MANRLRNLLRVGSEPKTTRTRVEINRLTREKLKGGVDKRRPHWILMHPPKVVLDLFGSVRPAVPLLPSFLPSSFFPSRPSPFLPSLFLLPFPSSSTLPPPFLPRFFALPCTRDELNQRGPKRPWEDALKSNEGVKLQPLTFSLVSLFLSTLVPVVFGSLPTRSIFFSRLAI